MIKFVNKKTILLTIYIIPNIENILQYYGKKIVKNIDKLNQKSNLLTNVGPMGYFFNLNLNMLIFVKVIKIKISHFT